MVKDASILNCVDMLSKYDKHYVINNNDIIVQCIKEEIKLKLFNDTFKDITLKPRQEHCMKLIREQSDRQMFYSRYRWWCWLNMVW